MTDSLGQIADEHNAVSAQLGGTADLLMGLGKPLGAPDEGSVFAAVGSMTLGTSGCKNLTNGFSLLGGAAFVDQSAGGATVTSALLFGAAIRTPPQASQTVVCMTYSGHGTLRGLLTVRVKMKPRSSCDRGFDLLAKPAGLGMLKAIRAA